MSAAVFLDRDGVVNNVVMRGGEPESPRRLEEFTLCDGIAAPLRRLHDDGFRLFVVTNQPDIARGFVTAETMAAMTDRICGALPIEAVHVCPHDDRDRCDCRKPKPGLLQRIARSAGIALGDSFMVGDTWKDVEAGRRAGCRTILLRRLYNTAQTADHVVDTVADAADLVLNGTPVMATHDAVGDYLSEVQAIAAALDRHAIARLVEALASLRSRGGRLFLLGVGGSAANASHAANDFRKIAGIESYCLTDNVAELTARVNDEGWDTAYEKWLEGSRLSSRDAILVFSVGGGNAAQNVSTSIVRAVDHARAVGAAVLAIVGRDGGHSARVADACVIVPPLFPSRVTPHTEAFQAVLWHLIVSHPAIAAHETTWEAIQRRSESVPRG